MVDLDKKNFDISCDADEIRVDGLCREILREFHRYLLERGTPPLEAGSLAHGADYYLRDFLVSAQRLNLFAEKPGTIRRFAATWYIISTLEPNGEELAGYLKGVKEFYHFLHGRGFISTTFLKQAERECGDISYYEERIETFLDLEGDGYYAWEKECSLKS